MKDKDLKEKLFLLKQEQKPTSKSPFVFLGKMLMLSKDYFKQKKWK